MRRNGTHEPWSYFRDFLRSLLSIAVQTLAILWRKVAKPLMDKNFLLKRIKYIVFGSERRRYEMHGISFADVFSGDRSGGAIARFFESGLSGGRLMYSGSGSDINGPSSAACSTLYLVTRALSGLAFSIHSCLLIACDDPRGFCFIGCFLNVYLWPRVVHLTQRSHNLRKPPLPDLAHKFRARQSRIAGDRFARLDPNKT